MRKFEINQEAGTITYWLDADTGQQETFEIADLLDLLSWFKRREGILRKMAWDKDPVPIYSPMRRVGDYYVGVCADRAKVKVHFAAWDTVMAETEKVTRSNWLFDRRRQDLPFAAELVIVDQQGHELAGPIDSKGNRIILPKDIKNELTLDDCPPHLISEQLQKCSTPEWWQYKNENLSKGKFIKLP